MKEPKRITDPSFVDACKDLAKRFRDQMEIKGASLGSVNFSFNNNASKAQGGVINCKISYIIEKAEQFDCGVEK